MNEFKKVVVGSSITIVILIYLIVFVFPNDKYMTEGILEDVAYDDVLHITVNNESFYRNYKNVEYYDWIFGLKGRVVNFTVTTHGSFNSLHSRITKVVTVEYIRYEPASFFSTEFDSVIISFSDGSDIVVDDRNSEDRNTAMEYYSMFKEYEDVKVVITYDDYFEYDIVIDVKEFDIE